MTLGYLEEQPTREEIDASTGLVGLQFGQNWCGICRGAAPLLDSALAERPDIERILAADGPGLPLGRSFGIKLWPTLILLRDGVEVGRVVRPKTQSEVDDLLAQAAR